MSGSTIQHNVQKNEAHYDKVYALTNVHAILEKLDRFDAFLDDAIKTDTSWHGLYMHNFRDKLKGKHVLELGCGDGMNAAVMAKLGAIVVANDISGRSGDIIQQVNAAQQFQHPILFIQGDFLKADIPPASFDYVIGKAFVHHLSHEIEAQFLKKINRVLKPGGEVRFFEPAINSKWLNELRWYMPVPGRPSKFNSAAFKAWQAADPHPVRDDSTAHYIAIGRQYFDEALAFPFGAIERLHRILPKGKFNRKFRRVAYKLEGLLPSFVNRIFARSQLVLYRKKL